MKSDTRKMFGRLAYEIPVAVVLGFVFAASFRDSFDMRFRTTCSYGEVTVELESRPLKPWHVIATDGLD